MVLPLGPHGGPQRAGEADQEPRTASTREDLIGGALRAAAAGAGEGAVGGPGSRNCRNCGPVSLGLRDLSSLKICLPAGCLTRSPSSCVRVGKPMRCVASPDCSLRWLRLAVLATVAVAAAGCSADFDRFDQSLPRFGQGPPTRPPARPRSARLPKPVRRCRPRRCRRPAGLSRPRRRPPAAATSPARPRRGRPGRPPEIPCTSSRRARR